MLLLLLLAGCLPVLYIVIRKTVHHGILDADVARRVDERKQHLEHTLREGRHPDGPPPDPSEHR